MPKATFESKLFPLLSGEAQNELYEPIPKLEEPLSTFSPADLGLLDEPLGKTIEEPIEEFKWCESESFEGVLEGDQKQGYGVKRYADGGVYDGDWKDN